MGSPSVAGPVDTGLRSLQVVFALHGHSANINQIARDFGNRASNFSVIQVIKAAKAEGFRAKPVVAGWNELEKVAYPVIAEMADGTFSVIAGLRNETVLMHNTSEKSQRLIEREAFNEIWSGRLILVKKRFSLEDISRRPSKFGLQWFVPAILRHKKLFYEILVSSFIVQILALATPLMFQVIVDKVLIHNGTSTLTVIATGMLFIALFEMILTFLRNYLTSHTTSRIDVLLGARLYRHLISLPLSYFEARRVGDSVARVRELDVIRQFLTGSSLTLVIDLAFTSLFFVVLFIYSPLLAGIVAGTLPLYLILSLSITPVLRKRLNSKFDFGAKSQAFLVESVSGVQSVKSLGIEVDMQKRWENILAAYISAGFRAGNLANLAGQLAGLINKISIVVVLWVGAILVMEQALTIGQLIAFNMIAMRISSPVLRLVQLWQDFQQTGISLKRLGDILNMPTEYMIGNSRSVLPKLKGDIEFKNVEFRYGPDRSPALRDISFRVRSGEVIGIVGKSGSGKSTLSRLIQRLYIPQSGQVKVDGVDVSSLDPTWLRRRIGVVSQDNFLFNLSIKENIALAAPGISDEMIIELAQVAGADEFVRKLPQGYDTVVEEQGVNLSVGQRQRLAIARALANDPSILIMDEATSSLDYESEKIIRDNMQSICKRRTVLVIAHRLNTLVNADRILVIDDGRLTDHGRHDELIARRGIYSRLYEAQEMCA